MPLLHRLTEVSPHWAVWKNVDSALTGDGDIDAVAPPSDRTVIEQEFRAWAAAQGLEPAFVCPHIPGGLNLVALDPSSGFLFEVGVKERKPFRGSSMFAYDELIPLMEMDPRGFRRIHTGAEGVLKMVLNGIRPGGRADQHGLKEKAVAPLIAGDPAGAAAASALFGRAAPYVRRAASAVVEGRWDRGAALMIEARALALSVVHPALLVKRVGFKLGGKRACPVVAALLGNARRVPGDRDAWLRAVVRTHDGVRTEALT